MQFFKNQDKILKAVSAFSAGLILVCIIILFSANKPLQTILVFFFKPFSSWWYFGNMLDRFALIIFGALGCVIAFKSGCFNLGGEGQIYLSGFITAFMLKTSWNIPAILQFILVMLAVCCGTGLLGFFSGILKEKLGTHELLTSFLISSALIPIVDHLITGPCRDISGNLLSTPPLISSFILKPFFPPALLNISFVLAFFAAILMHLFFSHVRSGYRLEIAGQAREFALFAGFNATSVPAAGMAASACMHGLVGFFAITGTWKMCYLQFSGGLGWAALAAALIAGNNILAVLPAAFLYAWLQCASDAAVMQGLIKFDISVFLQASVFLFISADFFKNE